MNIWFSWNVGECVPFLSNFGNTNLDVKLLTLHTPKRHTWSEMRNVWRTRNNPFRPGIEKPRHGPSCKMITLEDFVQKVDTRKRAHWRSYP